MVGIEGNLLVRGSKRKLWSHVVVDIGRVGSWKKGSKNRQGSCQSSACCRSPGVRTPPRVITVPVVEYKNKVKEDWN